MPSVPDIFREIDYLAQRRGWGQTELARQLGVNRSLLAHLRAGRRQPTARFLARTARTFAEADIFRELFWHYLRYQMPVGAEEPVLSLARAGAPDLPDKALQALRGYVRTFPHHLVDGRGLIIQSSTAPLLTAAGDFVADSLRQGGVVVAQHAARLPILPSEAETLRRARLVVVERAEYATAAVQDLLAERLNLERPVLVTTATDLSGRLEEDLVRRLIARCSEVHIPGQKADA